MLHRGYRENGVKAAPAPVWQVNALLLLLNGCSRQLVHEESLSWAHFADKALPVGTTLLSKPLSLRRLA